MTFENVQITRWPDNLYGGPVRLFVRAAVGLSFIVATLCPTQWAHAVDQQNEKDFQVSCQHIEPGCIDGSATACFRKCRDCGHVVAVDRFPSKGRGRRETRCDSCHNTHRRSRYRGKYPSTAEMSADLRSHRFDGRHEGFQLLLELICDDVMKGLMN